MCVNGHYSIRCVQNNIPSYRRDSLYEVLSCFANEIKPHIRTICDKRLSFDALDTVKNRITKYQASAPQKEKRKRIPLNSHFHGTSTPKILVVSKWLRRCMFSNEWKSYTQRDLLCSIYMPHLLYGRLSQLKTWLSPPIKYYKSYHWTLSCPYMIVSCAYSVYMTHA